MIIVTIIIVGDVTVAVGFGQRKLKGPLDFEPKLPPTRQMNVRRAKAIIG